MSRSRLLGSLLALTLAGAPAMAHPYDPEIDAVLIATRAAADTIHDQAMGLAQLTWPADGEPDHRVAAAALDNVIHYGHNGLPALRAMIQRVDPVLTADVVAAFIEARWKRAGGDPPDYLPGLVDALWYGSVEAQRLAMLEVKRSFFPAAVLPVIDAARGNPSLMAPAVHCLGQMGDIRARFFLSEVLRSDDDRLRRSAAIGLANLGPPGLTMLRAAADGEHPTARETAVIVMLPLTTPEDLTRLYEYPDRFPEDDAALIERIRDRARVLEAEYQRLLDEDAASGGS